MTSLDNIQNTSPGSGVPVRTPGLTFTCILTFIGSGVSAFSFLVLYLLFDQLPAVAETNPFPDEAQQMFQVIINTPKQFFLIMPLLSLISLLGAVFMWKMKKLGFHFYTSSQLLMLLVPFFMVQGYTVPLSSALLTAAFIGAYGINMNKMR